MKKVFPAGPISFDGALLILRAGTGVIMAHHGLEKLMHFGEMQKEFMDFMGLGMTVSLGLVVFAELLCSLLLLLGLLTRLALIPLMITMLVAVVSAHSFDIFGKGELGAVYLVVYAAIFLLGPGGYSVDAVIAAWMDPSVNV